MAGGWIEIYTYPLVDPASGKITGVIEYAKDVTERVRAEEALRHSQEKFRLVTETIQDVFWMSDSKLNEIIYVSPAYEQVWGRTCQSLYESPRSFVEAIHPEDRQEALATMIETHSQGKPYGHEYRIIRPDGAVRWIHDRGFPIKDEQGRSYMMTGVATDITARKQAEEAVRLANERFVNLIKASPYPSSALTSKVVSPVGILRRKGFSAGGKRRFWVASLRSFPRTGLTFFIKFIDANSPESQRLMAWNCRLATKTALSVISSCSPRRCAMTPGKP